MEGSLQQTTTSCTPSQSPTHSSSTRSHYGTPASLTPGSRTTHYQHSSRRKKQPRFGPYILGNTIGEGEFGKVKIGYLKENVDSLKSGNNGTSSYSYMSKQVAIKLIKRDTLSKVKDNEIKVYREINALKLLQHPNIVKLEEVLQNSKYIGIVLEYASGGEFYKYIKAKKRLKEMKASAIFAQLISGVNYIHSKGLVHRDLKLENLLLDKNGNLLITDFGFVNEITINNKLMQTPCGSPCYAAPELVTSINPYNARKADIWSCGIILYAMLAGYLPWDDDPNNLNGNDILKLYKHIETSPLRFPEYINMIPRNLLRKTLEIDPKKRISMRQIIQHEWLKPHQPFLSITTEEWDKNIIVKKHHQQTSPQQNHSTRDRFSVYEWPTKSTMNMRNYRSRPHSTCSATTTTFLEIKRNSLIIDSTLFNQPLPPKESQFNVISNNSMNSLNSGTSEYTNGTSATSSNGNMTQRSSTHARSNSAASFALQAVVNSDRENNNHILKDISNVTTSTTPDTLPKQKTYRPMSYHPEMSNLFEYQYTEEQENIKLFEFHHEPSQTKPNQHNKIETRKIIYHPITETTTTTLNNKSTTKKLFDFIKRRSIRI